MVTLHVKRVTLSRILRTISIDKKEAEIVQCPNFLNTIMLPWAKVYAFAGKIALFLYIFGVVANSQNVRKTIAKFRPSPAPTILELGISKD